MTGHIGKSKGSRDDPPAQNPPQAEGPRAKLAHFHRNRVPINPTKPSERPPSENPLGPRSPYPASPHTGPVCKLFNQSPLHIFALRPLHFLICSNYCGIIPFAVHSASPPVSRSTSNRSRFSTACFTDPSSRAEGRLGPRRNACQCSNGPIRGRALPASQRPGP